jgi:Trypsin
MRRTVLLLATMALAVLLAGGVANAIINGRPDGNRHPYVGMVYNDEGLCSGTLISPKVFLTAGHCTEFFEQGDSQTYVTFRPNADFDPANAHAGTPYTHPKFCFGCAPGLPRLDTYDVGVVVLKHPVRTAKGYGKLPKADLVDTLDNGKRLTAVGYGVRNFDVGGGPPEPTDAAVRYRATLRLLNTDNRLSEMFVKLRSGSAGRGGQGTCFGDSGGPFFLPNQRTIVAVTSFGTNPRCAGVEWDQRVDLPRVLRWVRSFL